jgi:hypothetical protein
MAINKKRQASRAEEKMAEESHKNFMGGVSFDITNPIVRLMCVSASSFFGEPMYYKGMGHGGNKKKSLAGHSTNKLSKRDREYLRKLLNAVDDYAWRDLTPAQTMERAIDAALDFDPEATLRWAVMLRREENIRVTPQVILVRAANHPAVKGTGLVRKHGLGVTARADEPATQMAYQLSAFGKPIPNALRRLWMDFLAGAQDYHLAKYRMESREVKTVDVANMAFGKSVYGLDLPIGRLVRGELVLGDSIRTWESIISGGGSWEEAVEVMGHMALLRNIRNLVTNKVDPKRWVNKLVAGAKGGKQLPFRYLSAYLANEKSAPGFVLDAIEECLMISVGNLPHFKGRTLSLSDNSGSAHGTPISEFSTMRVCQIGNMMGVLTGMCSDEGLAGVFGDRYERIPIRKRASFFDQQAKLDKMGHSIGGGTENGIWLALDRAIRDKEHWDNIFVYSDMQAGHGGLYGVNPKAYKNYLWPGGSYREYIDVPKMVKTYRERVNPRVNVFLVQIAGYEDTIMPEYYDRTYILGGWSGNILRFAKRMSEIADGLKQ